MKKIMKFSALLCAMMLLATACTREEVEPNFTPALDGSEIQFGARAGFENGTPETRTVYSGENYTSGGKTYERIDWVNNDLVEIYCPEAKGLKSAQYVVTSQKVDDVVGGNDVYDEGYLSKLNEDAGALQWNAEYDTHHFYAMYPSSETLGGTVSLEPANGNYYINGVITNEQHSEGAVVSETGGKKHYEFKPDMRFAYMAAVGEAKAAAGNVKLDFVPIVTAIRVELRLPTEDEVKDAEDITDVTINPVRVMAVKLSGQGLVGKFSANLSSWSNGYPAITAGEVAEEQSITSLLRNNEGKLITLNEGESLAFTIFVRPTQEINLADLKVGFSPDGQNFKTKGLQATTSVTKIMPLKKTSLKGLKLPYTKISFSYANWMESVQDDATILELSLPGTGGSFSYGYTGSNAAYYKQQTLPIFTGEAGYEGLTGQWEMGIRAFEMACDRPNGSTVDNAGSLDGQPIRVNQSSMGSWTVGSAVRKLLDKVSGSDETAMVIITYQPEGGTGRNRHAYIFAQALANFYEELMKETDEDGNLKYKDKIILYTPQTKMYDASNDAISARGKLMIVARINQRGEQEHVDGNGINTNGSDNKFWDTDYTSATSNWGRAKSYYTTNNIPILLVNGCGSAKDRWQARGYQVAADGTNYVSVSDMLTTTSPDASSVEYYMIGSANVTGTNYVVTGSATVNYVFFNTSWNVKKVEPQYGFATSNGDQMVWYQEWARVVHNGFIQQQGGTINGDFYERAQGVSYINLPLGGNKTADLANCAIRWKESYNEKVADAKATFDLAISKNEAYANYVFINSLCGYLVDPSIPNSYKMFAPTGLTDSSTALYDWWGSSQGNIYELSWRINEEFGAYVLDVISAQGDRGATGVVMMDRLSDQTSAGASNYLPSVIITNNLYAGVLKNSNTGSETPEDPNEKPENPGGTGSGGDDWNDGGEGGF